MSEHVWDPGTPADVVEAPQASPTAPVTPPVDEAVPAPEVAVPAPDTPVQPAKPTRSAPRPAST